MAHPLDGCRAKLLRADQHLVELRAQVADFLSGNPHKVVPHFDRDTGWCEFRLSLQASPPVRWSVIVGEVVHDWRSALDHLARQLAIKGGVAFDEVEFPIFNNEPKYLARFRARGKFESLTTYRAVLDDLQPYKRGAGHPYHPLWQLYELSNIDKHEALHVIGAVVGTSSLNVQRMGNLHFETLTVANPGAAVEGAVVLSFRLLPASANAVLDVYPEVSFDVQIGVGSGAATGRLLLPTLIEIRDYINNEVFPPFAPLFP